MILQHNFLPCVMQLNSNIFEEFKLIISGKNYRSTRPNTCIILGMKGNLLKLAEMAR